LKLISLIHKEKQTRSLVCFFRIHEYKEKEMKKNILKDYIFTFIANFDLTNGVWMLYLAYKGLSLFEIGLMEAVFHITSFTMEVPTGIVADRFGRKTSRVVGRMAAIVGTMLMIVSHNIFGYALSFIFGALSYNLESGAGEALLYDSLKELKIDDDYMKICGRKEVFFQVAQALSLPIGGYLATIKYEYVYIAVLVVGIIALLQSFSFQEPSIGKLEKQENIAADFIYQIKESIKTIKNSRQLSFMIVLSESIGVFATTTFFYVQNFLKMNGRNEFRIGIVLAIGSLLSAFGAVIAHKIEEKLGYKKTLLFFMLSSVFFIWMIAYAPLSELGIIGMNMIEAAEFVVLSDYINRLIPSEQRATVLSMQSMVFSLFMICLFPIVGFIGDQYNLGIAFIVIALLSTLATMFLIKTLLNKGLAGEN